MAGGGPKAPRVLLLAGQHKVDGLVTWQSSGVVEEMQGGQAPVDAIESQMFREPILQLVSSLDGRSYHTGQYPFHHPTLFFLLYHSL